MKIQTILLAVSSLVVFLFNPSCVRQGHCTGEKMAIITFFYLVNVSGQEIKVKVTANGNELFTREVRSRREPSSDIKESPPPGKYPAAELKVMLDPSAETLIVRETNSGIKKTFSIKGFADRPGGFVITVEKDTILLEQTYYPIR